MQARSGGSNEGGGASRRSQRTLTIELGLGHGGALAAAVNLVSRAPAPTFYLLRCVTGGHQSEKRLGAPDQDADQEPNWPLGQVGRDQS